MLWGWRCVFYNWLITVSNACHRFQTGMLQESKCVLSPFPLTMLIRLCALQVHDRDIKDVDESCLLLPIGVMKETFAVNGKWCCLLEGWYSISQACYVPSSCLRREGKGLLPSLMHSPYSCCRSCSCEYLASPCAPALLVPPTAWVGAGVAQGGQGHCSLTWPATEKVSATLCSVAKSDSTKKKHLFPHRLS